MGSDDNGCAGRVAGNRWVGGSRDYSHFKWTKENGLGTRRGRLLEDFPSGAFTSCVRTVLGVLRFQRGSRVSKRPRRLASGLDPDRQLRPGVHIGRFPIGRWFIACWWFSLRRRLRRFALRRLALRWRRRFPLRRLRACRRFSFWWRFH